MSVEFHDNTAKVKAAISDAVNAFLYEAGGEIQARTVKNSRTDTGQTKGSYRYKVKDGESEGTVIVGSALKNAIYEEFGTGEYALNGNGRKTPWIYKDRKGNFYRTTGKTPNRPLYNAFTGLNTKLQNRLKELLKQI